MKVHMYAWVEARVGRRPRGIKKLPTWFLHGKEADVSWEQIQELYATGINVMIRHIRDRQPGEAEMLLCVDTEHFQQR